MELASDGQIFTTNPLPLVDLLKGIDNHKVALPDFQRPWVWQPEMVHGLIISVAYRYPAGSLLTMPVRDGSFALRSFEGSGDLGYGDKPNLMILDGQQRLTSLYQAVFSKNGVTVKGRTYCFYLDVPTLLSDEDGCIHIGDPCFDKALFFVSVERGGRKVRYDGLKPVYEITTPEQQLEVGALPLWSIFDNDGHLAEWSKQYLIKQSGKDMDKYLELDSKWKALVQPWIDRIRTYPFPVVELSENMPLGAICHIFEKVNSTGVPLDVFDLCTAILWAQGFKLNQKWAELKDNTLREKFPMQDLHGTYFLMGLSLLDSLDRKQNGNASVAVNCRKQDLMLLKADKVESLWDKLVDGYDEAAKFMREKGIISQRILPYSTMIVPLSAIFGYVKWKRGAAYVGSAWSKVEQWYWCSVFSQRYSSQIEYLSARDFEQVINWLDGGEEPDVVRTFLFRSDYLQEVRSIRNAIYKGVLCLLAREGAKDFGGGGKVTTELFAGSNQDHHHIFPLNALKNLGVKDPRADSIVNKTLIGYAVNRSIGGRLPSQYTAFLTKEMHHGDVASLDDALASHAANPEFLRADNWSGFVSDRREKLRKLIEDACGKPTQPFSDAVDELEYEEPDEDQGA